jgi:hypothetical protein
MLRCVPSSPPKSAIVVELGYPFSRQAEKAGKIWPISRKYRLICNRSISPHDCETLLASVLPHSLEAN